MALGDRRRLDEATKKIRFSMHSFGPVIPGVRKEHDEFSLRVPLIMKEGRRGCLQRNVCYGVTA